MGISILGLYWAFYSLTQFDNKNIPVLAKPSIRSDVKDLDLDKYKESYRAERNDNNFKNNAEEQNKMIDEKQRISFNVLILGIDSRNGENARTDVIMLANVNPINKQINIISIPRDTRINIKGIGWTKINHSHWLGEIKGGNHLGTEATIQAVSDFLQVPIHYYVKINFEGFKDIVDTIDGIDIVLKVPVKLSFSNITLPAKKQHIDGNIALALARERYSLENGDFGRQQHQILILKAIANKMLDIKNINKIPTIIKQVKGDLLDTNFTDENIISLAWTFKGLSMDNINYIQIPGHDGYDLDPILKERLYYWLPDLVEVKKIINKYVNNEKQVVD